MTGAVIKNLDLLRGCEFGCFCFHCSDVLLYVLGKPRPTRGGESMMKTENVNPPAEKRLLRMRKMFATDRAILLDDYEYFTRRGEPNRQSKETRKSAAHCGRPAPKRS
jgi:hypothetical protein